MKKTIQYTLIKQYIGEDLSLNGIKSMSYNKAKQYDLLLEGAKTKEKSKFESDGTTARDLVDIINITGDESHQALIDRIENLSEVDKNDIMMKLVYSVDILKGE